jgi:hypothetical protein
MYTAALSVSAPNEEKECATDRYHTRADNDIRRRITEQAHDDEAHPGEDEQETPDEE